MDVLGAAGGKQQGLAFVGHAARVRVAGVGEHDLADALGDGAAAGLSLIHIYGSGGATAGPARTRLRDLSLKNPIGCREAPGCYNDSRAAPAREPSGALRTLAQSETQQRTPDRYSRGRGSTLTSGSAGRRHCRPP